MSLLDLNKLSQISYNDDYQNSKLEIARRNSLGNSMLNKFNSSSKMQSKKERKSDQSFKSVQKFVDLDQNAKSERYNQENKYSNNSSFNDKQL